MRVVCFMASVITEPRRLEFLRNALDSNPWPTCHARRCAFSSNARRNVSLLSLSNFCSDLTMQTTMATHLCSFPMMMICGIPNALLHKEATAAAPDKMPDVRAVVVREETKHKNMACCGTLREAHSAADVDAMIKCGCVVTISERYVEFHQIAVQPRVLREFNAAYPQLVARNRFADMQFRDFILTYGKDCAWPD